MRRLGVFGGTFDPPHVGHLALAERARDRLALDRVLFMPTSRPPHKAARGVSAADLRLAMTRLAVRGHRAFRVSRIEIERRGPSFTIDTLRALRLAHPEAKLYLLMGADSLRDFRTWREPDAIAHLATLVVARRPGTTRAGGTRGARIVELGNPPLDVSSRAIRSLVKRGLSARYLVPDAVLRFIQRNGLYRSRRRAAVRRARTRKK